MKDKNDNYNDGENDDSDHGKFKCIENDHALEVNICKFLINNGHFRTSSMMLTVFTWQGAGCAGGTVCTSRTDVSSDTVCRGTRVGRGVTEVPWGTLACKRWGYKGVGRTINISSCCYKTIHKKTPNKQLC